MIEPKRKHTAMVIGIAIATIVGFVQGGKMDASSQSDFIALVIAFLMIIGLFGAIGYFIDSFLHKKHSKDYESHITQKQFDYGEYQNVEE